VVQVSAEHIESEYPELEGIYEDHQFQPIDIWDESQVGLVSREKLSPQAMTQDLPALSRGCDGHFPLF